MRSKGDEDTPTRELVERAQKGDRDAMGRLVQKYESRLRALIFVRMGSKLRTRLTLDDILQDTYVKLFASLPQFRWQGDGSYFRWLGSIAENVIRSRAREFLRSEKPWPKRLNGRRGPVEDNGLRVFGRSAGVSPGGVLRQQERFERLEEALNRLSDEHREVIILCRIRGLPVKEVAVIMERSADAVSMLLFRALKQLKRHFGTTGSFRLPERSIDHGDPPRV